MRTRLTPTIGTVVLAATSLAGTPTAQAQTDVTPRIRSSPRTGQWRDGCERIL